MPGIEASVGASIARLPSSPPRSGADPEADSRNRAILRVVECHVLPRLALRTPAVVRPQRFGTSLSEEVNALTGLALEADAARSHRVLRRLHDGGASFGDLQLGLLAAAARRLDRMWRDDTVSFLDVTLATGSLHQMMRFVALELAALDRRPYSGRTILLAPAPGERHVFGAAMAAEFFRRDGWTVTFEPRPSQADLVERARGCWFDVLGLSVSLHLDAATLRATIAAIRAASLNRGLLVIAGGEALVTNPRLLTEIGGDAALAALEVAPARAHRLVGALVRGRA